MSEDILDTIREQIESNPIIIYMKGTPAAPQCGFSARTVQCLVACGQRFAYVDILAHPDGHGGVAQARETLEGLRLQLRLHLHLVEFLLLHQKELNF